MKEHDPDGINPNLANWHPSVMPSDLAEIFKEPETPMTIPEMPEGTPIPPVSLSIFKDGVSIAETFPVRKDSKGYFVFIAGAFYPVKVTWDGHRASSAIDQLAWATWDRPTASEPSESEEPNIATELRRIADALETIAKVVKQEFSEKIEIKVSDKNNVDDQNREIVTPGKPL